MSERRYKVGLDWQQAMLLPASIDDYVSPANLVRAIDAYVRNEDLIRSAFGFPRKRESIGSI
jgi:hypothetical protein